MKEKVEVSIQIKENMALKSPTRTDLSFLDIEDENKAKIKGSEDISLHSSNGRLPESFIREIKNIKSINDEEKKELLLKIKSGDLKAKNRMIEGNLGLVLKFAWRFNNNGVDYEDMFQQGVIGLGKAIDGYEQEKGAFSTYAYFWIRQEITDLMFRQGSGIKKAKNDTYKVWRINNFINDYLSEFGREPTIDEIETKTKIPAEKVENLINSFINKKILSLDQVIDSQNGDEQNQSRLYDLIPSSEPVEEVFKTEENILNILQKMIGKKINDDKKTIFTTRDYEVLIHYFGLNGETPKTFDEIGKIMGLTGQRINQIQERALVKIRIIDSKEKDGFKIKDLL